MRSFTNLAVSLFLIMFAANHALGAACTIQTPAAGTVFGSLAEFSSNGSTVTGGDPISFVSLVVTDIDQTTVIVSVTAVDTAISPNSPNSSWRQPNDANNHSLLHAPAGVPGLTNNFKLIVSAYTNSQRLPVAKNTIALTVDGGPGSRP